ncbi:MAG: hypothetical protein IJQ31_14430 [Thermoguttaceae bacterium]|nr:hypothetical protein [Thermoguttaceae bacterium]
MGILKREKFYGDDARERSLLECGNTEAEGFLCRFHLAARKRCDERRFSRGKRPARFRGKGLFEAVLPQGKAVNVACATVSPHSKHHF